MLNSFWEVFLLEFSKAMNNDFLFVFTLLFFSLAVIAYSKQPLTKYGEKYKKENKNKFEKEELERKRKIKEGLVFIFYFLVAIAASIGLKFLFYEERVCYYDIVECPKNSAFPSGHAFLSFVVALFFYRKRKLFALFVALALLISVGRLVIGVHFPKDIIGGFAFSVFYFSLWWKNDLI